MTPLGRHRYPSRLFQYQTNFCFLCGDIWVFLLISNVFRLYQWEAIAMEVVLWCFLKLLGYFPFYTQILRQEEDTICFLVLHLVGLTTIMELIRCLLLRWTRIFTFISVFFLIFWFFVPSTQLFTLPCAVASKFRSTFTWEYWLCHLLE